MLGCVFHLARMFQLCCCSVVCQGAGHMYDCPGVEYWPNGLGPYLGMKLGDKGRPRYALTLPYWALGQQGQRVSLRLCKQSDGEMVSNSCS
jgi:hypothetical protein